MIFDESQKEGNDEIWIDMYPLTRFLAEHTQAAVKVEGMKERRRTNQIVDREEEYEAGQSATETGPLEQDRGGYGIALGVSSEHWRHYNPFVVLSWMEAIENYLWTYNVLS